MDKSVCPIVHNQQLCPNGLSLRLLVEEHSANIAILPDISGCLPLEMVLPFIKLTLLRKCMELLISKGKRHYWFKSAAILLDGPIFPIGGVAFARVCTCSFLIKSTEAQWAMITVLSWAVCLDYSGENMKLAPPGICLIQS